MIIHSLAAVKYVDKFLRNSRREIIYADVFKNLPPTKSRFASFQLKVNPWAASRRWMTHHTTNTSKRKEMKRNSVFETLLLSKKAQIRISNLWSITEKNCNLCDNVDGLIENMTHSIFHPKRSFLTIWKVAWFYYKNIPRVSDGNFNTASKELFPPIARSCCSRCCCAGGCRPLGRDSNPSPRYWCCLTRTTVWGWAGHPGYAVGEEIRDEFLMSGYMCSIY